LENLICSMTDSGIIKAVPDPELRRRIRVSLDP